MGMSTRSDESLMYPFNENPSLFFLSLISLLDHGDHISHTTLHWAAFTGHLDLHLWDVVGEDLKMVGLRRGKASIWVIEDAPLVLRTFFFLWGLFEQEIT
ncbi:hypothetical protein ACMFMG_007638 [Clarireedia jacksonii]